tara:strand:+ start:298 stop:432 length:135 start_codon:yes stop_codon:yes gene_type:complete
LTKIGIKPDNSVMGKGIIRLQKLVDDLRRENELLKARVKKLEDA